MEETANNNTKAVSTQHIIEAALGVALLVLAFFAIASSDVSATGTQNYWTALVVVFAITSFVSDRVHAGHAIAHIPSAVSITLHWLGVLLAIQLVHYFVYSGRMANADIGLTNGVLLALGAYLFGVYSNWRMAVIGVALAVATAGIAFIEEFVWFLFIITVVVILVLFFGAKLFKRHHTA